MNSIFWTAYSNNERIAAIIEIEKVIGSFGFITDFKQFSDISISVKIEIEECKILELFKNLEHIIDIDKIEQQFSISNRERVIFLNITFTHATGDLRIETPAVPG